MFDWLSSMEFHWLTVMQVAALAIMGMGFALLGSVKLPLARKLEIDEDKVGGLISVFGLTLVPMVIVAGLLVDMVGKQAILGGSFGLVILSLIVLAHSGHYKSALLAITVLATGWSGLIIVLNVTTPPAFVAAEEIQARMTYAMNLGDFIFGMGTFLTPLIIVYCARRFGLTRTLYGFAVVSAIPLLLGLGVDWEALKSPSTGSVADGVAKLLSDPVVWLCSIAFFFHVPTEAAVAMWATTLMTSQKVSESKASALLSVFWLTFMGSRLATALLLPEEAATTLVVVMAICCIALTLGIAFCRGATAMCILIVVAGAIIGPIFPTLIGLLMGHVEPSLRGRAVGVYFCIGGVGWTALPILIGMYAKRTSVQRGFLIATGSAVLLTVLAIMLKLRLG